MKRFIFPFIYVASIFSEELIEQQNVENLLVSNDITFNAESVDFPTLKNPISNGKIKAPPSKQSYKRPWLAAGLSAIFPGLGQLYIRDIKSAGIMASSAAVSVGVMASQLQKPDHLNENIFVPTALFYSTNSSYSMYAAYRDARIANGITNYSYRMPMESFKDLTYAPFEPSILKKKEVWGGILGAIALASATVYFAYPDKAEVKVAASASPAIMPALALPVAIGEESLFRGFLQSAISESMNPKAGLIISSLAFGAAHIPNAQALHEEDRWRYYIYSLPLITALGAYCGWMTQKNHSLKESVALHMWYDFIVFTAGALAKQKASISPKQYAISVPF